MPTPAPLPLVNMAMLMPAPLPPTPSPRVNVIMPMHMPVPMSISSFPANAAMTSPAWPSETDLIFAPGSTKLKLTLQQPLVRVVIQDSIEILRAALLFENAFPSAVLTASFLRDSLSSGAKAHLPGAAAILQRLQSDTVYLAKILLVVSSCMFKLSSTETVHSYVLGFASFEVKSKSGAVHLSGWRFWGWVHWPKLSCSSRNSWMTTIICTSIQKL